MKRSFLSLWLALPLAGCTELGPIGAGICGNGVVEAGEDCDQAGESCVAPGKDFECRYSCETSACPAGWVCGVDKVCRQPSGTFSSPQVFPAELQLDLSTAEIDGKAPADLVSATFSGKLSVRYGGGGLGDLAEFQSLPIRPATGNLTAEGNEGDKADDIAHVGGTALGVLLGSEDRELRPVAYSPIPVKDPGSRFVILDGKRPVASKDPKNPTALRELRFYTFDEILVLSGNRILDAFSDKPDPTIVTLPFDVGKLLPLDREIPWGDIDERPASPCAEMVLMEQGASEVNIYSPCKAAGYEWNDDFFALPKVKLAGGAHLGPGGSLADLDGDGHLDLLLLSDEQAAVKTADGTTQLGYRAYVAYGAGDGTFNSASPAPVGAGDQTAAATNLLLPDLPLAAGDINGDQRADFVLARAFVFSRSPCPVLTADCFEGQSRAYGGFTSAYIGDLNRDGLADVAAVSPIVRALFFFNGTGSGKGSPVMNLFQVPTEGYPSALVVGDFDGDLVRDVAIMESQGSLAGAVGAGDKGEGEGPVRGSAAAGDTFSVLFGKLQGAPEPPVRMGELGLILGMAPGHLSMQGYDRMTDVGVLAYDQVGSPSVALFAGASNRQLQSPFILSDGTSEPDRPVAVAIGQFTSDSHADVAALALSSEKKVRLWLAPSTGAAALSSGTTRATAFKATAEIEPCSATLLPADLDADGKQELLVIGRPAEPNAQGTRIVVARSVSDAWDLGTPVDFPELKATGHPAIQGACRGAVLGQQVEQKEHKLGHVAVADLDGSGVPELVVMSFVVSEDGQNMTSSLIVFPESKLDAASARSIAIPEGLHPLTFALLDADTDPELELAYFAVEGVYVAELDLAAATLTNVATLQEILLGPDAPSYFETNPPMTMTAADYDGDGVQDVAMGYLFHTEVFYGVPVKP